MNNLNIDQSIKHVMKIVENIQCAVCDKADGQRLRYSCGHIACDKCVIEAVDCQICLSPSQVSSPPPRLDYALTQRVKNASALLKQCQDLFNIDVFRHKRLSEQLRIEKELFPECIQAPAKYENKRKSTIFSYKNKENRTPTFFPGEETSLHKENITMESSVRYVQQWLNTNDKDFTRKPFRDLNVNTRLDHNILTKKNHNLNSKNNENVSIPKTSRKRSHFKTMVKNNSPLSENKSITNQHYKSKKVKKELSHNADLVKNEAKTECDNDESGIFMDNDLIVIDDSQEMGIEKDRNAWLAVLEANKNEENESTSLVNLDCRDHKTLICETVPVNYNKQIPTKSDRLQSKVNQDTKVPFYKKSFITETCTYCNIAPKKSVCPSKNVKIVIDNAAFTTTIQILNDVDNSSNLNTTNSVSVQTDICETVPGSINGSEIIDLEAKDCREDLVSQKSDTQSEDLFEDEGLNIEIENECNPNNLHGCLVIAESDSDMEMERSGPLPVTVDVHRSCDESEYGILSEIVNIQDHDTRSKRGPRGLTPTSTDSSEKENFNPNRMKKPISKKKKSKK